ncbi:rod shape-determining protein RodA [Microbispora siamensis]|uniref:peptidoglycan glycosyltransferase n=1 Tax=Microbispora siamensis TaxID=564413 RepID=A0ABQ4GEL2_9ACTN|nr:rod shape-determining protein RodA [Microbispora siamensis]GIH59834.1 rod shape-determining protein RodA [Microbispora siamensis]
MTVPAPVRPRPTPPAPYRWPVRPASSAVRSASRSAARLARRVAGGVPDWGLAGAAGALCLVGVVLVWASTGPRLAAEGEDPRTYLRRQLLNVAVGAVVMVAFALADHGALRAWTPPLYALGCLGLLAVLTPLGRTVNGAQSWLGAGALQVQPSELVKPALVLILAMLLGEQPDGEHRPRGAQVLLALAVAAVPLGLVMLQPDLGTFTIIAAITFGMLVAAGVRWRWIGLLASAGAAAAVLAWVLGLLRPHQVHRLLTFADPLADPQGAGYNAAQALITVGSGGLSGRGLLRGDQTGGGFVPEQHTDFVFTVAGEELGFAGSALVLLLLWAVLARGLRVAARAASPYGTLAAAGIVCWFGVQTFVNVGMVVGLLPIVGVPLPLVSYGGSSVVACLAAVGVLMSVRGQDVRRL